MPRKKIITTALVVLAAGLLSGVVAPPAGAWSKTLYYSCSGPGFGSDPSYTFAAVFESDLPATLPYGSSRATTWENYLFAPESFRSWAVSQGYTTVVAGARLGAAVDGAPLPEVYEATPVMVIPTTQRVWTWDTSPTTTIAASTLGPHALSVTSLEVTVAFHDASGPRLATSATCVLDPSTPAGDTLVDTYEVVAATTATTLAITGDTATATVTSNGTAPVGVVTFSLGGTAVAMDVTGGKATVRLPAVPPGDYRVSASFVPSQPTQLTSSSATASYVVAQLATGTRAYASYRPRTHVLKAKAVVTAEDDSAASGRLTFVLRRNGRTLDNVTVRLSGDGVAVKKFRGIRKPGRYVVVATYLGSRTYEQSTGRARLRLR